MKDWEEKRNEMFGSQKPKPYANIVVSAEEARGRAINASKIKAEEELRPVFIEVIKASTLLDNKINVY